MDSMALSESAEMLAGDCCWWWGLRRLVAAKTSRVWRKAERAASARVGGNHSRVWRSMSDPLTGWSDSARHDISDPIGSSVWIY